MRFTVPTGLTSRRLDATDLKRQEVLVIQQPGVPAWTRELRPDRRMPP
jgi:hypothetical protein